MTPARQYYILVGIETDPTFYHGEHAHRPALLDHDRSKGVLTRLAAELRAISPRFEKCTLSMAGALFDQAQVLRPQFPLFKALESLERSGIPDNQAQAGLLAVGAEDQQVPRAELQPEPRIFPGTLQLLPLVLAAPADPGAGPDTGINELFAGLGQLSGGLTSEIGEHFQVSAKQARFMTIQQLGDLLRRQLESQGFLPLWELLDAAIRSSSDTLEVRTGQGLRFKWQQGAIHGYFETFDWWARLGAGSAAVAPGGQLQTAYTAWTREYRHYRRVLEEHGVTLALHLPGFDDSVLDDSFLLEESTVVPALDAVPLTEHVAGELGTLAVTAVSGQRQVNFYPLRASGINDLHSYIREHDLVGDIACPGHICYDEQTRQLVADTLPPQTT